MHRLPGWMSLLGVVAVVLVCVGSERALVAASGGGAVKQDAEDDARREATRMTYMRYIDRANQEVQEHEARLRRHMLDHPGGAAPYLEELGAWRAEHVALRVALMGAQAEYDIYQSILETGDFESDGMVVLAIEQSQRMVEIDGELRALEVKRAAMERAGADEQRLAVGPVESHIAVLSLKRDEAFDRMARHHFHAGIEAAAQRVSVLADQVSELEPTMAEARVRHEDAVRAEADRASIERALVAAERRRDELVRRLQDLELESDLDAALR